MKRHGGIWDDMVSYSNLLACARKAMKGKRKKNSIAEFEFHLEREVEKLHRELKEGTYRPGTHRNFRIFEPKERLISAAPFRDRVVHHALTGALEPIFEPIFIHDSYACRKDKGTHKGVDRCQEFSRRFPFVLKADIQGFFPSIDHAILKSLIARKIKDPKVLALAGLIIDIPGFGSPDPAWFPGDDLFTPMERKRGLPIGNQTSQFFANVYLNPLDHFIQQELGVSGYVRYVDDFLLFAREKKSLHQCRRALVEFLCRLRLNLHPIKNQIFPVREGIRFLGYRFSLSPDAVQGIRLAIFQTNPQDPGQYY